MATATETTNVPEGVSSSAETVNSSAQTSTVTFNGCELLRSVPRRVTGAPVREFGDTEIAQRDFVSEAFPENLLNKLNYMRKLKDAPLCDVTFKCRDGDTIRAHSCILNNIFGFDDDSNRGTVQIDLDSNLLASLVDYCYTGRLRITTENIADLFHATQLLKLHNDELRKELDTFLEDNLRGVASRNNVVVKLREDTLRRVMATSQRAEKMLVWCFLLFNWWSADTTKRMEAYLELMKLFEIKDLDMCMGRLSTASRTTIPQLFHFGTAAFGSTSEPSAERDTSTTQTPASEPASAGSSSSSVNSTAFSLGSNASFKPIRHFAVRKR